VTDREWLKQFVGDAARDPRRLVRTIMLVRKEELLAAAAVLELVPNPAVQVFGYAALARRSRERREEFLARAAGSAETLPDAASRVGVLTALFDVLGKDAAGHFLTRLVDMLQDLSPEEQQRYRDVLERRRARAGIELGLVTDFEPQPRVTIDVDEVASSLAKAHARERSPLTGGVAKIRAIASALGRSPKVRLDEIGASVGIHPRSFNFIELATDALKAYRPAQGADIESLSGPMTRPERVVSTGFANESGHPERLIVAPGGRHYYFIEVGARVEGAAESERSLPEDLEAGSVIDVVMFTNDDGLTIEGPRAGRFRIEESGAVIVSERAAEPNINETLLQRRMFFAFRAPDATRQCGMRCSFYSRGVLIQSRNIAVPVGTGKAPTVKADYVLSRTLSPRYLAQLESPRLSVMLNQNEDGTHSFRFYGESGGFGPRSSTFGEFELQDHITRARKGFRQAAWGKTEEWTTADTYRFSAPRTVDTVMPDLLDLARRGRVLWDAIIDKLSGGPDAADSLRDLMRRSGHVQFALKEAANSVLPIAILYDHALDISRPDNEMRLCPAFIRSLGRNLIDEPCLNGDCPNRDNDDVVCAGGFWGFRHALGLPVSIGAGQSSPPEVPTFITSNAPSFTIAVSTDPTMSGRATHLANLDLRTGIPQQVSVTRDAAMKAMTTTTAPIVYFYCHGGMHEIEGPFLEVGPRDGPRIARNNLRKIRWRTVRPIVFMNGCRTTRVAPEEALELVSAFVATAGASGVIGTEITIFESLATPFAEAFFEEFVANARSAGDAIRRARLRLLKDSLNPLGLVYIPFLLSSLNLRPTNQ